MSTICRTCLQKSSTTFKTNQTITDFGGGEVKISMVLRFCMPELYLGLSSNPEICSQCKENLTVAYLFKKKCLHTENMIGTFLKNARCTARSVELDDVLAYFNEQVELELKVDKAIKQSLSLNAQDILSEWDDVPDEALNSEKVIPEVPQPIPSPTKPPRGNKRKMKFCHEMGLFFDPEGNYYDCSGYLVDKDQIEKEKAIAQKEINVEETPTTPDVEPITRDCPDFVQNVESSENFCKITSVFSLCSEDTNKDLSSEDTNKDLGSGTNDADKIDEASNLNNANNANQSSVDVKDEPLEVEINGERIDFNYTATDEETLDASETASYEDMSSTSRLQGIIDNLPEIADTNQYVDVPEFVHINNFGLKELEELRRQQQNEATAGNQKIVLNFKNKLPNSPPPEPSSSGGIVTEKSKEEKKAHSYYTKVPLSTLPETLLINGKKMVKCAEGYKLMDSSGSKPKILSPVTKVMKSTNSATQEISKKFYRIVPEDYFKKPFKKLVKFEKSIGPKPVSCSEKTSEGSELVFNDNSKECRKTSVDFDSKPTTTIVRRRKKIKIVPVNDNKVKLCSQKGVRISQPQSVKLMSKIANRKVKFFQGAYDRDVVVLFTNYTFDGDYINDHDYLVNPYKRNKILIEEANQWYCICYICQTKHDVHEHVPHMQKHDAKCKICDVDLGTPYMLNVHVRAHSKPCRHCTERVPYGKMEIHEQKHMQDDIAFQNAKRKRACYLGRGRRKKFMDTVVGAPSQPTPLPIQTIEPELVKEELKPPELIDKIKREEIEYNTEEESSEEEEDEDWRKTSSSSKKPRKRRRRITRIGAESVEVESSSRVLRSKVRKSYSETESEDIISNTWNLPSSVL